MKNFDVMMYAIISQDSWLQAAEILLGNKKKCIDCFT
jgi:hypothetical protein